MPRVFLDANVLFSASRPGSAIARLIQMLMATGEPVASDLAAIEARRNIALKWPEHHEALEALLGSVAMVRSTVFDLPVPLIDKDRPILCAAIRGQCQYLATGDRTHFGHLYNQTVQGVTVVSLARLAEILIDDLPQ